MNNENGKRKIDLHFLLYLMYVLFVIVIEWTNFLSWIICGENLSFGIAEILSLIVLIVIFILLKKSFKVERVAFNFELFIGCTAVLVFGVMKSAYPDGGFDTFNYHLIAQNPRFENYFLEDFGYGNFQVWGFRLCDRMFYYFRHFLGYRFGTYLNTLTFVVSLIQIYVWGANAIRGNRFIYKLVCNKLLWSLAILFSLDALMMYGSYYVDAVAIPIGLEVIRVIICEYDKKVMTKDITYFALLNGLWIAMKMTNIVYVIPCVIIYVVLHIKSFKIKNWISALIIGIFPFAEYLIFNCLCTGNPIFPYYNSIFKSPYFPIANFKDNRWGGTSLLEKLFWLWSLAFNPEYRKSEIFDEWNGVLIIGLIGTVMVITYGFVQKIKDKKKIQVEYMILVLISVASSLLWSFTTGYSRYYVIGRILWGLLAFHFVTKVFESIKYIGKSIAVVCLCVAVTNTVLNVNTILRGRNWSWRNWSMDEFKTQMASAFRDNDIKKDYEYGVDLFVINTHMSMGVAELIDDSIYTINIPYFENVSSIDGKSLVTDKIDESGLACDLHARALKDLYEYIEILNNNLLYVTNIESVDLSIGTYEMVYVENMNGRKNTVWTSKDGLLELDVSDMQGEKHLKFIGGRIDDSITDSIKLEIKVLNSTNEQQVESVHIDNSEVDLFDIIIEFSEMDRTLNITPYYESNGEIVGADEINGAFCMNVIIE